MLLQRGYATGVAWVDVSPAGTTSKAGRCWSWLTLLTMNGIQYPLETRNLCAQQERQRQTFDGLDCRGFGARHAGGWLGYRRRRAGGLVSGGAGTAAAGLTGNLGAGKINVSMLDISPRKLRPQLIADV
jgi:hypothetical protein